MIAMLVAKAMDLESSGVGVKVPSSCKPHRIFTQEPSHGRVIVSGAIVIKSGLTIVFAARVLEAQVRDIGIHACRVAERVIIEDVIPSGMAGHDVNLNDR